MKKTNETFENTSVLERDDNNVTFGTYRVQPATVGRNIGLTPTGFELPVTQANPQLAFGPVSVPVIPQQPVIGFTPATGFQPMTTMGVPAINPFGYAVQNPYFTNQFNQPGFAQPFIPQNIIPQAIIPQGNFGVTPIQAGATTPFMTANLAAQQAGLWNTGAVAAQDQFVTLPASQAALQGFSTAGVKKDFVSWIPETNILETEKTFRIEMSVPGISRETCKVGIEKGMLWVSGTRTTDAESKLVSITRKEFSYGSFYRSFLLTDILDAEKIQVSCHHGLLSINIPKKELTKKLTSEIAVN